MAFTKPKTAAEIRAQRPDTPERTARRAALVESLEAEVALREIRERRDISQAVLAERLEVSRPRVSTIERAGRTSASRRSSATSPRSAASSVSWRRSTTRRSISRSSCPSLSDHARRTSKSPRT
jgi:DNA-binding transcriptional regulator YiaG